MFFIYKIVNNLDQKFYIGQTKQSIEARFKQHLKAAKQKQNTRLYNAINKYGSENFTIVPIENCESKDKANEREIYWISLLNTRDDTIGYNITVGGDNSPMLNRQHSDQAKAKLRESRKKYVGERHPRFGSKLSDETKSKISQNHIDVSEQNNPMFGKKHTEESKQKMRDKLLGKKRKPFSEETKRKLSERALEREKHKREKNESDRNPYFV